MSIKIQDLQKQYGEQYALNNISFDIPKGQVVGFLGPNGAGKSTTMKILTGYISPTSGKAEVCGFNVSENPIEVKKRVGYLPESNPLYKDMYVKEYLHYVANVFKLSNPSTKVEDMISMTGLGREKDKKIYQLSKGYKQRVGIAQAMIHDPEVLILDEPTSGLDPNQLEEIRKLIIAIGEKKTVMLSTHIMQEVEAMCERVIIINKGEIVADNTSKDIKNLGTREAIILVEFSEKVAIGDLDSLKNVKSFELENGVHMIHLIDKDIDIRQDIFDLAVSKNLSILSLNKKEVDLEGVFKDLTNN